MKSFQLYQTLAFLLTFLLYCACHCCRSAWAQCKTDIIRTNPDITESILGTVDMVFLFSYAIGMIVFGHFGDRIDQRLFIVIGAIPAALFLMTLAWLQYADRLSPASMIILMGLNGLAQATSYPGCMAIFGGWFSSKQRGFLLGIWSGCTNLGDIIGYQFGNLVMNKLDLQWQNTLIISGVFFITSTILLVAFIKISPAKAGFTQEETDLILHAHDEIEVHHQPNQPMVHQPNQPMVHQPNQPMVHQPNQPMVHQPNQPMVHQPNQPMVHQPNQPMVHQPNQPMVHQPNQPMVHQSNQPMVNESLPESEEDLIEEELEPAPPIPITYNFITVWGVPRFTFYTLSYSCQKSVFYGLLFWLPMYLDKLGLKSQSSSISSMNDVGTFIGGTIAGYFSDKIGLRVILMFPMIAVSIVFMALTLISSSNALPYYFFIFFIGFFIGGPNNLISSASAIDLAKQPALKKDKSAMATISAVMDGFGAFVAAISQQIISLIPDQTFYFFISMALLALIALVSPFLHELKVFRIKMERRKSGMYAGMETKY